MNQINTVTRRDIKQHRTRQQTIQCRIQTTKSQRKTLNLCKNHLYLD